MQYFSPYQRVKLIAMQTKMVEIEGNKYLFAYYPSTDSNAGRIDIGGSGASILSIDAIEGSEHEILGLKIVVKEVHPDYVIILVKPL